MGLANLRAMRSERPLGGAVFNVGTGRRIGLLDLVAAINAVVGTNLEPDFQPPRAGDVNDSRASLDRIRDALGSQPLIDLEEALRRTLRWSTAERNGGRGGPTR